MALYAYIYVDPLTNVPFYVGKGSRDRSSAHMAKSTSHNKAVWSKIQKLKNAGLKPIISKIKVATHEAAFAIERFLISLFGKKCDSTGSLYNLTDGGDGPTNLTRSEEARRKTSESLLKFYQTHECKKTPEAIEKMKLTKSLRPTGTGKWMNNGAVQTKVKLKDVEAKTKDGWILGTLKKHVSDEYRAKLREAALNQWQRQKENKQ
jgi:hypothetical protein